MTRVVKNIPRFLVACAAVVLAYVAVCNLAVLASASRHTHAGAEAPAKYTVIVLGARVFPETGRLSDMLSDRMKTALDLYRADKAERFLLSGDHGRDEYDEVNAMKAFLLAEHVPAEDIFLDHAGFDTYDSMYRARDIFQVDSAIIVTQAFHLPRAVYIARALGLDAVGVAADRQQYVTIRYNRLREIPARVKSVTRVMLRSRPTYLGEAIPITGEAAKSWDRP